MFSFTMKTGFLPLVLSLIILAAPGHAGAGGMVIASRSAADARKDVDTRGAGKRAQPEAVLLEANRQLLRVSGGTRAPVVLRALLCEASFLPFAPRRKTFFRKTRFRGLRSPVAIIHFPRPPPSV